MNSYISKGVFLLVLFLNSFITSSPLNIKGHKDGKLGPCDVYCRIVCGNDTNIPYCNQITNKEYPCSCMPEAPSP